MLGVGGWEFALYQYMLLYRYAVVICVSSYMSESKFSVIWCVFVDKSVHNYFIVCIFSAKKRRRKMLQFVLISSKYGYAGPFVLILIFFAFFFLLSSFVEKQKRKKRKKKRWVFFPSQLGYVSSILFLLAGCIWSSWALCSNLYPNQPLQACHDIICLLLVTTVENSWTMLPLYYVFTVSFSLFTVSFSLTRQICMKINQCCCFTCHDTVAFS